MKAVIQRVANAQVTVDEKIVGKIEKGLLILLGIGHNDSDEDIEYLVRKIIHLRIFNDTDSKMNLSLKDIDGDVLIISQFTLYADTKKGNRPSYIQAAQPIIAKNLYEKFLHDFEKEFDKKIQAGIFGADMKVELLNDGPVTIIIDSKN
jgi:D-tyrosyl-tRNA(Tyr) deacylase